MSHSVTTTIDVIVEHFIEMGVASLWSSFEQRSNNSPQTAFTELWKDFDCLVSRVVALSEIPPLNCNTSPNTVQTDFSVSAPEGRAMFDWILWRASNPRAILSRMLKRANEGINTCPFQSNGACEIFEARPLECRIHPLLPGQGMCKICPKSRCAHLDESLRLLQKRFEAKFYMAISQDQLSKWQLDRQSMKEVLDWATHDGTIHCLVGSATIG